MNIYNTKWHKSFKMYVNSWGFCNYLFSHLKPKTMIITTAILQDLITIIKVWNKEKALILNRTLTAFSIYCISATGYSSTPVIIFINKKMVWKQHVITKDCDPQLSWNLSLTSSALLHFLVSWATFLTSILYSSPNLLTWTHAWRLHTTFSLSYSW